jgi:hypothetical protein
LLFTTSRVLLLYLCVPGDIGDEAGVDPALGLISLTKVPARALSSTVVHVLLFYSIDKTFISFSLISFSLDSRFGSSPEAGWLCGLRFGGLYLHSLIGPAAGLAQGAFQPCRCFCRLASSYFMY